MKKITLLLCFLMISCASHKEATTERLLNSTLWMQKSGEYKALCYQTYRLASSKLELYASKNKKKNLAVILDADETVLDNSLYQGKLVVTQKDYEKESWKEWVKLEKATFVPGAKDFLLMAQKLKVEIFLISNRSVDEVESTHRNLEQLGLTIPKENLLFKAAIYSKEERRKAVQAKYEVAMLVGDNLIDFTDAFENLATDQRNKKVEELRNQFGERYIVLPNPAYGDWESAILNYNMKRPRAELIKERYQSVESY